MDNSVLLLVKHVGYTAVVKVSNEFCYHDLVDFVCGRWSNLTPDSVSFEYCISGHSNCILENEDDFQNMILLVNGVCGGRGDIVVIEKSGCVSFVEDRSSGVHEAYSMGMLTSVQCSSERDLLTSYVSHKEKVLLSASWANGVVGVGQCFEGGSAEFRTVLCKYAIELGFQFKYTKNEKGRITAECKFKDSRGCLWRIHASVVPSNGFLYIRKFNKEHTCGASVRTSRNPRMSSDLVGSVVVDDVRSKPLTRPFEVVRDFKDKYGLDISYHHAWLGVEKARRELYGDDLLSFDLLRWYTDETLKNNPGSRIEFEYDHGSGHFKRLFVSFYGCIYGFNFCRPLLFLDGTFLKGRYKGNLLAATGKDGNQGLFPVAFGVVDSENLDNWMWFCGQLRKVLSNDRIVTFISDRNPGLVHAVSSIFPSSPHAFCMIHLEKNLREKYSGVDKDFRERIVALFRRCAYAPTEAAFCPHMDQLRREGGKKIDNFLHDLPLDKWCHAYFKGKRYGEMSSNAAESFNSQIAVARHMPITEMVDKIRVQIMKQMSYRRDLCKKWSFVICPEMEKRLHTSLNEGRTWKVIKCSDDVFEVQCMPSVLVNIRSLTCSCFQWQLNEFPCSHACVVIQSSGNDLNTFVDSWYHVSSFSEAYSKSIFGVPTVTKPNASVKDMVVRPPLSRKQPGRPRKKRIPSRVESFRSVRCGRCGKYAKHNRKTCNETL